MRLLYAFDGAWASALSNLIQIAEGLVYLAASLIAVAKIAPRIAKRLQIPFSRLGKIAARRRVLRKMAGIRAVERNPRLLISHLVQPACALAIVTGGLLIHRAIVLPERAGAMFGGPDRSLLYGVLFEGVLQLVLGTGLILAAILCARCVRGWADPAGSRRRIIERYCRAFRQFEGKGEP